MLRGTHCVMILRGTDTEPAKPARKRKQRPPLMATCTIQEQGNIEAFLDASDLDWNDVKTKADGPQGSLPLTDDMLRHWPSGDLFALSQNAGMGWLPEAVARDPFLILSTQGGLRAADGTPIALGYHTGHWEIGLLVQEAAEELKRLDVVPFAGMVSDPCDGRTQGTAGMMDSLPYRNDAAIVFRRLIRSLPRRKGVLGIATCDKGLPAMMMALAGSKNLACVLVPGGVTLPPKRGKTPARSSPWVPATLTARSRWKRPPSWAAGPVPAREAAASSWEPRPPRRSWPRRWG